MSIVSLEIMTIVMAVPDMVFGEECHYKKEYIRAVLRMKIFIETVEAQRKAIENLEQQLKNKSCNCQRPQ